jgi:hypothetical protein
VVAGGAVYFHQVARPEILDPRGVEGEHSGSFGVLYMFPIEAGDSAAVNPDASDRKARRSGIAARLLGDV